MGQWLMRVGDLFEFKQPVAPSTKVVLGIAAWCLLLLGWHWAPRRPQYKSYTGKQALGKVDVFLI